MGYWLVVQGNLNLFEVAVFHGVGEQQTWQRDQWEVPVIEAVVNRLSGLLRARTVSRAMSGHLCEYNLTNKMNAAEMQSDTMHFIEYIINRIYENVIST